MMTKNMMYFLIYFMMSTIILQNFNSSPLVHGETKKINRIRGSTLHQNKVRCGGAQLNHCITHVDEDLYHKMGVKMWSCGCFVILFVVLVGSSLLIYDRGCSVEFFFKKQNDRGQG